MKCLVCHAHSAKPARCAQCGYDTSASDARDPGRIRAAREAFRDKTLAYAPESRVSSFDKLKPWLGLVLGMALFVFWLRACSSGGWF